MNKGQNISYDTPLEVLLKKKVDEEDSHHHFPHTGTNRFMLYTSIKTKLQERIYRDIGDALAKDSGGKAYTRHDLDHVDDVIRKAGQLLGANSDTSNPAINQISPYEIFVLLVACLIHDAGNIDGRSGHALRARKILDEISDNQLDPKEIGLISKIARAHGGKTLSGNSDTIGELRLTDFVENSKLRPRFLAAVLRFADELAENPRRANRREEKGSKFPNLFCSVVTIGVDYRNRWISLDFSVSDDACALKEEDENGREVFFLDYIAKRVIKTELERRYCDRQLRGQATFDAIRVTIELIKDYEEWELIHFELEDRGYPSSDNLEDFLEKKIRGCSIAEKYITLGKGKGRRK